MPLLTSPTARRPVDSLLVGTLLGGGLVAAGLVLGFLALETPMISRLIPGGRLNADPAWTAMLAWALVSLAGGSLLFAGTNRLAASVATLRARAGRRSPVIAALGSLPPDVVVATGVVPNDGRPIPELVVGPFGVAVVHEMGAREVIRQVGASWEVRTRGGWIPTEHPLDRAERDAERVRHWLTHGDLDFVVRVHAVLITPDTSMLRSPMCAVITANQVAPWIAALPRQRTLTQGRRNLLVALVRNAVAAEGS